jgi:hypothetical protein
MKAKYFVIFFLGILAFAYFQQTPRKMPLIEQTAEAVRRDVDIPKLNEIERETKAQNPAAQKKRERKPTCLPRDNQKNTESITQGARGESRLKLPVCED